MKNLFKTLLGAGLALCSLSALGQSLVSSYFPLNDGDQTAFVYDGTNSLTISVSDMGGGEFQMTESTEQVTASLSVQEDEDTCYLLSVQEGWTTVSLDPPVLLVDNQILQNGGAATTATTASQSGISYPATFTVKVASAGTVTVPAGTFYNCRSMTSTEVAKVPGHGTITASALTAYLAPNVGIIKTLVRPGVWAALVSGTVGGVDVTSLANQQIDTTPPTISISTPKSGQKVGSAVFAVAGAAKDNVAVASVYYRLNGGSWMVADSANAWTNWTASVSLSPGANTISAYAVDSSGNNSPTNTVKFNFVSTPLTVAQGTFNGLFLDTNDVTEASSGFFTLAFTKSGAFTGKIMTSGSTYTLPTTTPFDAGGQVQLTVPTKQNTLTFNLQLDLSDPASRQITGTVSDGAWTAGLTANRAVFSATTNKAVNYEGLYTLAIAGSEDAAASPGGFGCATLSISPAGLITMKGNLADGTAMSQSVSVSKDGRWPFYASYAAPPAGNGGAVFGWLTFSNQPASALGGTFHWFRPAGKTPAVYQSGFTSAVPVVGSAYNPTDSPLLALTSGQVTLDGGNLPFAITNQITLEPNNAITLTSAPENTNKLALTINKTTGAISGSFANPSNPKQSIKINGVLLQSQTSAAGYFLGTNQSGAFLLEHP
jgi:hypothetical protein